MSQRLGALKVYHLYVAALVVLSEVKLKDLNVAAVDMSISVASSLCALIDKYQETKEIQPPLTTVPQRVMFIDGGETVRWTQCSINDIICQGSFSIISPEKSSKKSQANNTQEGSKVPVRRKRAPNKPPQKKGGPNKPQQNGGPNKQPQKKGPNKPGQKGRPQRKPGWRQRMRRRRLMRLRKKMAQQEGQNGGAENITLTSGEEDFNSTEVYDDEDYDEDYDYDETTTESSVSNPNTIGTTASHSEIPANGAKHLATTERPVINAPTFSTTKSNDEATEQTGENTQTTKKAAGDAVITEPRVIYPPTFSTTTSNNDVTETTERSSETTKKTGENHGTSDKPGENHDSTENTAENPGKNEGITENPDKTGPESPNNKATDNPDNKATENPDNKATENPDGNATENPDKTATGNPDKTGSENPDKSATENPDKTGTENPDKTATENPDNNTAGNSEKPKTDENATGDSKNPGKPGGATENPEATSDNPITKTTNPGTTESDNRPPGRHGISVIDQSGNKPPIPWEVHLRYIWDWGSYYFNSTQSEAKQNQFRRLGFTHHCGGSLYSRRHILTAGMCAWDGDKFAKTGSRFVAWFARGRFVFLVWLLSEDQDIHKKTVNYHYTETFQQNQDTKKKAIAVIELLEDLPKWSNGDNRQFLAIQVSKPDFKITGPAYFTSWRRLNNDANAVGIPMEFFKVELDLKNNNGQCKAPEADLDLDKSGDLICYTADQMCAGDAGSGVLCMDGGKTQLCGIVHKRTDIKSFECTSGVDDDLAYTTSKQYEWIIQVAGEQKEEELFTNVR